MCQRVRACMEEGGCFETGEGSFKDDFFLEKREVGCLCSCTYYILSTKILIRLEK